MKALNILKNSLFLSSILLMSANAQISYRSDTDGAIYIEGGKTFALHLTENGDVYYEKDGLLLEPPLSDIYSLYLRRQKQRNTYPQEFDRNSGRKAFLENPRYRSLFIDQSYNAKLDEQNNRVYENSKEASHIVQTLADGRLVVKRPFGNKEILSAPAPEVASELMRRYGKDPKTFANILNNPANQLAVSIPSPRTQTTLAAQKAPVAGQTLTIKPVSHSVVFSDSAPVQRKKNYVLTSEQRKYSIERLRYHSIDGHGWNGRYGEDFKNALKSEEGIKAYYIDELQYEGELRGYYNATGAAYPYDLWQSSPKSKEFFLAEPGAKLYEIKKTPVYLDEQKRFRYGKADGPFLPELTQLYQARELKFAEEEAIQKKKAQENHDKTLKELESLEGIRKFKSTLTHSLLFDEKMLVLGLKKSERLSHSWGTGGLGRGGCRLVVPEKYYKKSWTVPPFESHVNISIHKPQTALAEQTETTQNEFVLSILPSTQTGGESEQWHIWCNVYSGGSLKEIFKQIGLEFEEPETGDFFSPATQESKSTFTLEPKNDSMDQLASGAELKVTRDLYFPPSVDRLIFQEGPVQCEMNLKSSKTFFRKISTGETIKLGEPTIRGLSENRQGFPGSFFYSYYSQPATPVWHIPVSSPSGIDYIDCKIAKPVREPWSKEGISIKDFQTVFEKIGPLTAADGTKYTSHELGKSPSFLYKEPEKQRMSRGALRNLTLSLKPGKTLSIPADSDSFMITKPDAPIRCQLPLPQKDKKKLRLISDLKLVNRGASWFHSEVRLSFDDGEKTIDVKCTFQKSESYKNFDYINFTYEDFKNLLDPRLDLIMPAAEGFASAPPAEAHGLVHIKNRYRDCGGDVTGKFEFKFNKEISILKDQEALDLGNGCKMKFSPSKNPRIIKKDAILTLKRWQYKREVEQIESDTNFPRYTTAEASGENAPVSVICQFQGPDLTDQDTSLSCKNEFLKALEKVSEGKNSIVEFKSVQEVLGARKEKNAQPAHQLFQ